jgi:octaheme c-type cytochrome (tetrathionate reductase family)
MINNKLCPASCLNFIIGNHNKILQPMVAKLREFYKGNLFIRVFVLFLVILLPWVIAILLLSKEEPQAINFAIAERVCEKSPPVFHAKFDELDGPFENAKEVTKACLACHTERHREILNTVHWNWEREDLRNGVQSAYLGKRSAINNFCTGVQGSEKTCTRCHIGYGYEDKNTFDFDDPNAIDCLICHDNTGKYKKARGRAGWPAIGDKAPDYEYIAKRVCSPKRENCGTCHFWGGGGNNVKHGDLEKALLDCSEEVDVHMAADGTDMSCIECHVTENHNITGRSYSNAYSNTNRVTCEQCHRESPHADNLLNEHTHKVSCQACHIPVYAKVNATKMTWDWSTAGRLSPEGEPITEHDHAGNHSYLSIKGDFTWEKNVVPEYVWFNGTADHYLLGDTISSIPLQMNPLHGSYACSDSKIVPVKVHRGKQIFDPVHNYLIQPKLHADKKGEGAYWKDFDWQVASAIGMEHIGLSYSGKYDWIETEQYMLINHMVSPADQSVTCIECHSRDGRLAALGDFYMPGRDYSALIDISGMLLLIGSVVGVSIHGLIRLLANKF